METMQWSDIARSPRDVAAAVESSGVVRLERRGDVSFVMMRADRVKNARHGMETTARLLRDLLALAGDEAVVETLMNAYPWARFLPEKDQHEFTKEFLWTLEACSDLDVWTPLGRMMHEWQETATIHADPALAMELSRAVDADLGPVTMPTPEVDGDEEE